jgi:hypothetical protein
VTIVSESSSYCGQSGRVRRVFWREHEPWVLVRLGVGGLVSVPWEWTDLPAPQLERESAPGDESTVLISPIALRDFIRFVRDRRSKPAKKNHFSY